MEFLIILGCCLGIAFFIRQVDPDHYALPTLSQLKAQEEAERWEALGMQEVNRYLAPYTTFDDTRVDIACQTCNVICMDATEAELDASGWTQVNGTTRCPDCSAKTGD